VLQLQMRLAQLGYYSKSVTGHFGVLTAAAVREFQLANGLLPDGVAGPLTLAALYSDAVKLPLYVGG